MRCNHQNGGPEGSFSLYPQKLIDHQGNWMNKNKHTQVHAFKCHSKDQCFVS